LNSGVKRLRVCFFFDIVYSQRKSSFLH